MAVEGPTFLRGLLAPPAPTKRSSDGASRLFAIMLAQQAPARPKIEDTAIPPPSFGGSDRDDGRRALTFRMGNG